MPEADDLREVGSQVEALLESLRSAADPTAHERAEQMVRLLVRLYGTGLQRIVEIIGRDAAGDQRTRMLCGHSQGRVRGRIVVFSALRTSSMSHLKSQLVIEQAIAALREGNSGDSEQSLRQWLLHHPSHLDPANPADEKSIWEDIVTIVSEKAGIARSEISKSTHFFNDLNFG